MRDILGQEVGIGDILLCREPGHSGNIDSLAVGIVRKNLGTRVDVWYIPIDEKLNKWEQQELNRLLNHEIAETPIYTGIRNRSQIVKLNEEQIEQLRNEKVAPNNRSAE
jgi:hypothetical protein